MLTKKLLLKFALSMTNDIASDLNRITASLIRDDCDDMIIKQSEGLLKDFKVSLNDFHMAVKDEALSDEVALSSYKALLEILSVLLVNVTQLVETQSQLTSYARERQRDVEAIRIRIHNIEELQNT